MARLGRWFDTIDPYLASIWVALAHIDISTSPFTGICVDASENALLATVALIGLGFLWRFVAVSTSRVELVVLGRFVVAVMITRTSIVCKSSVASLLELLIIFVNGPGRLLLLLSCCGGATHLSFSAQRSRSGAGKKGQSKNNTNGKTNFDCWSCKKVGRCGKLGNARQRLR